MVPRKQLTRQRLVEAALELFAEDGYDEVSVKQIAARAGVTEMTFFRHFPTKASLVVSDPFDPAIGTAIARQPATLDPITRAARGISAAWRELPPSAVRQTRERLRIVSRTPSLRASLATSTDETGAVMLEALTAAGTPRRDAVIAVGAVMGALQAALLDWSQTSHADIGQAITAAVTTLADRHG